MKKVFQFLLLSMIQLNLMSYSHAEDITKEFALNTSLEKMQEIGGGHFGTDSASDYLNITKVLKADEINKYISKLGEIVQENYQENFYFVEVYVNDCSVSTIVFLVNKTTGLIDSSIWNTDGELSIDKY
jgi:hypothetical protein